jgi:hypothetical protein
MMNAQFSREQQRTLDFVSSLAPLRQGLEKAAGIPSAVQLFDSVTKALSEFGNCELRMRHAERNTSLGINPGLAKSLDEIGKKHQATGLMHLQNARATVKTLKGELQKMTFPPQQDAGKVAEGVNNIRAQLLQHITELEVKPSDALKIRDAMDRALEPAKQLSADALPNFFEKAIDELRGLRERPDRGTNENIPWWKIAGIVLIAGAFASIVIACIAFPPCWILALGSGVIVLTSVELYIPLIVAAVGGFLTAFC